MTSRFVAVTSKEISQIIEQAVPEIHEEGDKIRFGSFKVTRPMQFFFFFGGGGGAPHHPTLKLSGIPTFTFVVSLTHRMDNI